MNLIEIRNTDHELKAACGDECHNAVERKCSCICGGLFHGAARRGELLGLYRHYFLEIVEHVATHHPHQHLHFAPSQLELWPEEGQAAPP